MALGAKADTLLYSNVKFEKIVACCLKVREDRDLLESQYILQ